jgi:hypothetical protein
VRKNPAWDREMIVVIGPSNAGKSTLLQMMGVEDQVSYTFEKPSINTIYVHYNLLKQKFNQLNNAQPHRRPNIAEEKSLISIFDSNTITKAIILISPVEDLVSRAKSRSIVEARFPDRIYDQNLWIDILKGFDFLTAYEQIFDFLDKRGIDYSVLYSDDSFEIGEFASTDRAHIEQIMKGLYVPSPAAPPLSP